MIEFKDQIIKFEEPKKRGFFPDQFSNEIYFSDVKNFNVFEYRSNFSIKFVVDGYESYKIENKTYKINSGQYLIVNDDQRVEVNGAIAKAISIFLDKHLINDVYRNLDKNERHLLNNPFEKSNNSLNFFETIYSSTDLLGRYLNTFHNYKTQNKNFDINEELFYNISLNLIKSQIKVKKEIKSIDKVKYSTRCELYRRVLKAKIFIESQVDNSFNIHQLAMLSCMSKFHLIRTFKEVYKTTPYNYYLSLKVERSKLLLKDHTFSITQVANISGFNDLYSFSRRFKFETGLTPLQYRMIS